MMMKIPDRFKGTFSQFLAVFTGTLMAISDGMQYGWSAPVTPILLSDDSPVKTTKHQAEFLETILMIGAISGLPLTIYLTDKIGRKKCIIISACTSLIVWIVLALVHRIEVFIVARFFAGMASDMAFIAMPMYIAEIAEQRVRGFLASLIYLMMLIGIILVYIIVPFTPFYVASVIGSVLLISEIILFPFMPDSPYYLLIKDKPEEARHALSRLRQNEDVEKELKEIKAAVDRQLSERGKFQDLFLVKSNRKALLIMTVLNGAQHLSSISVILMNLHSLLVAADSVYIEPSTAAIMFSSIMFVSAIVASILMDKYGRKCLLITSSICSGICLTAIAVYFTLKNHGVTVLHFSWLPVVAVMVYGASFKLGLGMVPIVMTAELFPAKLKAFGMTLADSMFIVFSIIALQIYQQLGNYFGIHVPFYIFGGCCFATTIFAIFGVPETKGKTLDEIQFILKGKKHQIDEESKK